MDTKTLARVAIKEGDQREVTAVFSTLGVRDHDGDITRQGAFTDGAPVQISAYGHASWGGALPVGKGTIRIAGDEAILDGQFFDTSAGRDTFVTVRELAKSDMGEWSYGFDINEFAFGEVDGQRVRFLDKLTVHEVSPVLLGAGINTRTLAAKAAKRAVGTHETEVVSREWDGDAVVAALPDDVSPADLRKVFAWAPPGDDAESKSNWKFPHHHGVGGPANVRALIAGIAVLNGARGGADIPDAERQGVYNHLAAHLRDADREPPELRAQPAGAAKFSDEGEAVLAALSLFGDRAADVLAMRQSKGKGLGAESSALLEQVQAELKRLDELLARPVPSDDTAAQVQREFLRFAAALAKE